VSKTEGFEKGEEKFVGNGVENGVENFGAENDVEKSLFPIFPPLPRLD
jgi:hypothetical protein